MLKLIIQGKLLAHAERVISVRLELELINLLSLVYQSLKVLVLRDDNHMYEEEKTPFIVEKFNF